MEPIVGIVELGKPIKSWDRAIPPDEVSEESWLPLKDVSIDLVQFSSNFRWRDSCKIFVAAFFFYYSTGNDRKVTSVADRAGAAERPIGPSKICASPLFKIGDSSPPITNLDKWVKLLWAHIYDTVFMTWRGFPASKKSWPPPPLQCYLMLPPPLKWVRIHREKKERRAR